MTTGYLPLVILAALVFAFGVVSVGVSTLVRPKRAMKAKYDPYECGIEPVRLPATENYPVKFYVVAMIFIIFDIETIFLIPWGVAFRSLGLFGLGEMVVFIGLVLVAYLYVWQKGGLDWEGPRRIAPDARLPGEPVALPPALERGPGERPVTAPREGLEPLGAGARPARSGGA